MHVDWKFCARIAISVFLLYLGITYWPAFSHLLVRVLQAAMPLLGKEKLGHQFHRLMLRYVKPSIYTKA